MLATNDNKPNEVYLEIISDPSLLAYTLVNHLGLFMTIKHSFDNSSIRNFLWYIKWEQSFHDATIEYNKSQIRGL